MKLISDEKLEEAKEKVDQLEHKRWISEDDPDIYRLRLSIAIAENDEENIIFSSNKIVVLSRLEAITKQFKEYEEIYDLDFSEIRLSLKQEVEANNQIELDVEHK